MRTAQIAHTADEQGFCSGQEPLGRASTDKEAAPPAIESDASPLPNWPLPPTDVNGVVQLMMGGSEPGAQATRFLERSYQTNVVHVRRPRDPSYFTDRLMNSSELRGALSTLARHGLLAGTSRAHRNMSTLRPRKEGIPNDASEALLLDDLHAAQNKSLVRSSCPTDAPWPSCRA